jgi:hypothetical protein
VETSAISTRESTREPMCAPATSWTDALLGMAVCEVLGRSLTMALRRRQLQAIGTPKLA